MKNTRISKNLTGGLAVIAAICLLPSLVFAGEDDAAVSKNPVNEESPWETNLRLDGWTPQLYIQFTDDSLGINNTVFIDYGQLISNLDWAVPLGMDVRYKRFGFMPDLVGVKISGHIPVTSPLFNSAGVQLKFIALNLVGYYRLIDQPDFSLDVLGGARYLYVDVDVSLAGGALGNKFGVVNTETSANIWDGVVGARIQHNLGEKWFYWVYGDVGAGDSDLTWQIWANLGYNFGEHFSVSLGYRYLTWDESVGSSGDLGLTASGPILTFNWKY